MASGERSRILAGLNGRTQLEAFDAAKKIWDAPDPKLELPLIRTLRYGKRPFHRAAAAWAMQVCSTAKTIRALEEAVKDKSEHPRVRGEAAEALAHGHRRRTHELLLKTLADRNKEVRFWSAFALGEMAEQRAVPILKQLIATDKRVVKGFHSVAKEAADAIENIRNQKKQHRRKNGCVFCVRD